MQQDKRQPKLSWRRDDFERRLAFPGERYLKVGALSSGILAFFATLAFYSAIFLAPDCAVKATFFERGVVPYPIVGLGFWTFFLLWIKTRKIKLQRKPLRLPILPDDPNFVLTVATVDEAMRKISENAESPKDFLLYRRIAQTLAHLRNLGQVAEADALFRSQAERDENLSETSYSLINGFLWAIPILGFIGTVLGLSSAIASFTSVLTSSGDVSELTPALKQVTAGLSTAFETTFLALTVALALQIYATFVRKSEEELLDDIAEFCAVNVVLKLRVDGRSGVCAPPIDVVSVPPLAERR